MNNIYTINKKREDKFPLKFRQTSPSHNIILNTSHHNNSNKNINQKYIIFKKAGIKHIRSNDILPKATSIGKRI